MLVVGKEGALEGGGADGMNESYVIDGSKDNEIFAPNADPPLT